MPAEWGFPDADPVINVAARPWERSDVVDSWRVSARLTEDAVVVIPGIMGTELVDTATGKLLWGLQPGLLARMWLTSKANLAPLAVDPSRKSTVRPARLLQFPTLMPGLAGIEPYTKLVSSLRAAVRHPDAVLEFGYDWRLSVSTNADLLAHAIYEHIRWWRQRSDRPHALVHLVAHSMGGLLCQALTTISGAFDYVGLVITLGAPFEGAAKAAVLLGTGSGAPVRASGLKPVAVTMPGIYDLLPTYRCVDEDIEVRRLTAADVESIGGSKVLAEEALQHRDRARATPIPRHRAVIGVAQPTICTLTLHTTQVVEPHYYSFDVDDDGELLRDRHGIPRQFKGLGDGTVPRNSARPWHDKEPHPLPQQHGPIARSDETIAYVLDRLLNRDTGPRLAGDGIGIRGRNC